ncbi:MAG: hypothetical protein Q4G26_07735 [Paracoccus sp. (in: a-proteobacteria)]|nr:hypothetical protein [Paracoccus sp. (in: a-proteobacteria)]
MIDSNASNDHAMPMTGAGTRFMIVAQARSGSTFLRELLNAQPDITCHGEVFSRAWIDRLCHRPGQPATSAEDIRALLPARDADPLAFMASHVMAFDSAAVGFKIISEDLIDPRFWDALTGYAQDHGLRVIHLRRLNDLAALASRKRMGRFGISHSDRAHHPDQDAQARLVITGGELKRYRERQAMLAGRVDAAFPGALQARYETLADDFPGILAALGLPGPRPFTAPLRKMAPPDLADLIENYPELRRFDRPPQPVW